MNSSNRRQGRGINQIQDAMNALKKLTHTTHCRSLPHRLGPLVEFTQIGPSTESTFQVAIDYEGMGMLLHVSQCSRKGLQFLQAQRTELAARRAVQRELDDSADQNPGERSPLIFFHA